MDLVPTVPKEKEVDLRELGLNDRQIRVLKLMVNEDRIFTNREYRQLFNVTNKTASTDLNGLVERRMVQTRGKGRSVEYLRK